MTIFFKLPPNSPHLSITDKFSKHLQILKNFSIIERCPWLGHNFKNIVTDCQKIVTKWFVCYLGCPLLGGFTLIGKTGGLLAVLVVYSVSYAAVKNLELEGSIYSFSFYGQMTWLLLALFTQTMSYLSRNWGYGVSPRFHLVVFVIGLSQEKWKARGVQDYQHQWWKGSLQTFFQL